MLNWLWMPDDVPLDIKRLIAEVAWGKDVAKTTVKDWRDALVVKQHIRRLERRLRYPYYHRKDFDMSSDAVLRREVGAGRLAIVQWLLPLCVHIIGPDLTERRELLDWVFAHACCTGREDTARWLRMEGASNLDCAYTNARIGGHTRIANWLVQEGASKHLYTEWRAWPT